MKALPSKIRRFIKTRDMETGKKILQELWKTGKKPLLVAMGGVALLILLTPLFTYIYFVRDLSSKENIITRKNAGVILLDRNEKPFFSLYEAKAQTTTPLSNIPEHTQQAVIAIEDKDFYKHPGFSIAGIGRAIVTNIRQEELAQGGSTITQQLVKNTLLSQDKNFLRKYQEIVLAIEIDRRFSKEDILEMYLNTAYFGEGAFGIQSASQAYFSKDSSELTLAESALLAGILPAPSALSPLTGNEAGAYRRQNIVLDQMQLQGYITEQQVQQASNQEIQYSPKSQSISSQAPHFALMVKDQLIKEYGEQQVARSGFTVKTTLDLEGQKYAQDVVKNRVTQLSRNNVSNGSAVVMDPETGEILALVGSHDWNDEQNGKVNMATSPRQPGSSFKPIVYAKALDEEIVTPATQIEDKEISFPGGYKPKNYDNRFRGKVTVRYALANSLNIPAVLLQERVGIEDTISYAEDLGITTLNEPSRYGLSLVLGAAEIPLTQMTESFAVFANEGKKVEPTTILEVKDRKGTVIFNYKPEEKRVISSSVAFLISSILSDNKARSDTFGGSLTLGRPAAVKTGTTEDYRDALTIGYTPQIVVGAWVGNNDREPMDNIAGSLGAAPIWRQLMDYFHRGLKIEQFTPPPGIVKEEICVVTQLNGDDNQASISAFPEFFIRGTESESNCPKPTPTEEPTPTDDPEPTPTETPQPTEVPTSTPQPTDIPVPTPTQPIVEITLP